MKNVSTAYHNANKANTRSSDFLIVSDTGFDLNVINSASGWSFKSNTGYNENIFTMWRCNKKTSEAVNDYGYVTVGGYSEKDYYTTASERNSITFFFENDCYPTEFYIEFYDPDISTVNPVKKTAEHYNGTHVLTLTYYQLFTQASWTDENLKILKFYFTKWSRQGVKPVILFATYGEPSAIFMKDDLLSVNIVQETDPTTQSIPYNSYSCVVIDETDAYNPLIKDSKIYDLSSGQKFRFFNFEKGFEDNEAITDELSLFDHEVCPVGVAYFRNALQQGTAVTFDFMDIVEKYDNIFLSDNELVWSSHFVEKNVKNYLKALFGNDLDTSSIPSTFKSILPFYKESKTQILLYLAQVMQKYVYVTAEGRLSFKEKNTTNEDFCIELVQSYQNPVIEKNYDRSEIEINTNAYSVSQNTELATNSIEFIYKNEDGKEEIKAYSDVTQKNLYDAETGEKISTLPKHNVSVFKVCYRLNDIYDKDSLFSIVFGNPKYMSEILKSLMTDLNFLDVLELSDGSSIGIATDLSYYDTYVVFSFGFSREISSNYECFNEVVSYCASALLIMGNLQGSKIISTINPVGRQIYSSKSNPITTINNPVIADPTSAKVVEDWISSQIDNSVFSIETDWRGDCSLELGDNISAMVALTKNGERTYENQYSGTIVKNVIEYNGALRMQTTLYAPIQ